MCAAGASARIAPMAWATRCCSTGGGTPMSSWPACTMTSDGARPCRPACATSVRTGPAVAGAGPDVAGSRHAVHHRVPVQVAGQQDGPRVVRAGSDARGERGSDDCHPGHAMRLSSLELLLAGGQTVILDGGPRLGDALVRRRGVRRGGTRRGRGRASRPLYLGDRQAEGTERHRDHGQHRVPPRRGAHGLRLPARGREARQQIANLAGDAVEDLLVVLGRGGDRLVHPGGYRCHVLLAQAPGRDGGRADPQA